MARIHRWPIQKKNLNDPDNHDGVITHSRSDILEYEFKWAFGSISTNNASRSDGNPAELFQILKDDAVKMLYSICQQVWKIQQWPQSQRRAMLKNVQTTIQLSSFHRLIRFWSKSSKLGFSSTWTKNLQTLKLDLEKAEEPAIKLPTFVGS